jgi:hypothetical protein
MLSRSIRRRSFLAAAGGAFAAIGLSRSTRADEAADGRPPVAHPRATDGDTAHEPHWDEKLTLTVGQGAGDLQGTDDKVLQAAVDYVARLGGGTVEVLPGTYTLRNSVYLPSGIRLRGHGAETIITKIASERVQVVDDSDWYDQEITLAEGHHFEVGDGVVIQVVNPHDGGPTVIKRTLVARSGNRFKLNDGLRENVWVSGDPTCASLFPLLTSENTADVVIENLALDGNRENNEHFDGNYGGCIFLQDCNRYTIREVEARNNNGDGISFQICHDVRVENCHSHDNADLGVHPGSGSQRPLIINNLLENNGIGIFWCWGVKYGLAEHNRIVNARNYGISIGHNDTDNVMRHNEVIGSGISGILFRDESRGEDFWPNRNTIEDNRIVDSGDENGVAIDIQGRTREVTLARNEIRETREAMNRVGIRISAEAGEITLADNLVEGFANAVVDQRA